jgi:hypothetical protein
LPSYHARLDDRGGGYTLDLSKGTPEKKDEPQGGAFGLRRADLPAETLAKLLSTAFHL